VGNVIGKVTKDVKETDLTKTITDRVTKDVKETDLRKTITKTISNEDITKTIDRTKITTHSTSHSTTKKVVDIAKTGVAKPGMSRARSQTRYCTLATGFWNNFPD
jgi:hypothetical protein